ncbi:MAG TPA: hypothetical protein VJ824_03175 [Bacillota bacterium]|nr:hypothetical protein [Bacillota bacterium]
MADYRYNVNHDVSYNELDEIRDLLSGLKSDDTCSIIIDGINNRNADRVIATIDKELYSFFTRGIGDENDTEIMIKRKH